jgi:hypothetical protein
MKKKSFLALLVIFVCCRMFESPFDPSDPNWVNPAFYIDSTQSSHFLNDTTTDTALTFVLIGNMSGNQFRWKLDSMQWTSWTGANMSSVTMILDSSDTGYHKITSQTCYHPSSPSIDSTIFFYMALRPQILKMSDTLQSKIIGDSCMVWVSARGTGELRYQWFKDSVPVTDATNDTLFLPILSLTDSGHYQCLVTGNYGVVYSSKIDIDIKGAIYTVHYINDTKTDGLVPVDTMVYASGDTVIVKGNEGNLRITGYAFKEWCRIEQGWVQFCRLEYTT